MSDSEIYSLMRQERQKQMTETAAVRSLETIAREIRANWPRVYFGAVPYLNAMMGLDKITDDFGADSAESIVLYFLSNATTWRGDVAKRVKLELKSMLPCSKGKR